MTKANIQLPNGTKISVEGTSEEVAKTIRLMKEFSPYPKKRANRDKSRDKRKKPSKIGVIGRIREIIKDDFFKEQKDLKEIRKELEQKGHIYPVTSLSPALIRLVRSRELRRIKRNKIWTYVGA